MMQGQPQRPGLSPHNQCNFTWRLPARWSPSPSLALLPRSPFCTSRGEARLYWEISLYLPDLGQPPPEATDRCYPDGHRRRPGSQGNLEVTGTGARQMAEALLLSEDRTGCKDPGGHCPLVEGIPPYCLHVLPRLPPP